MQSPNKETNSNSSKFHVGAYKKEDVFPSVLLQYLTWKDILTLRCVCKRWDQLVLEKGKFAKGIYFKLCNNPSNIETFGGLSQNFPVKQFTVEGLDLETNVFGDPATFRRFAMGHCPSMSALVIQDCTLSTGRFFEMLAFCKNLKHLAILDSPSIFRVDNGIGIMHWSFCHKSLRSNLANLQKLSITGNALRDVDVWGLGTTIHSLKELQVICVPKLPVEGINKILNNSCETLKTLILRGVIPYPGLAIGPGKEMKNLQKLHLEKNKMGRDTMKKVELFLERCPCLVALHINSSYVGKTTLSKVTPNLATLRLWNCLYESDSFADAKFPNLQKLSLFTGMHVPQAALTTQKALIGLSDCKMPMLTDVDLRLLSDGADYLRSLQIINQPQLTVLSLSNCSDIAGTSLRQIFKHLTGLLSLSITKCVELYDDSLCPVKNKDEEESLGNLKNLKILDLSGTGVGNKTLTECVTKMKKLRTIKLNDNTIKVDKSGIRAIMKATETSLKSLKYVSVDKCIISQDDYKAFRLLAPRVTLECRIETSFGIV